MYNFVRRVGKYTMGQRFSTFCRKMVSDYISQFREEAGHPKGFAKHISIYSESQTHYETNSEATWLTCTYSYEAKIPVLTLV